MKKLTVIMASTFLVMTSNCFSLTQPSTQVEQKTVQQQSPQDTQQARQGCVKPIGFFPTPSKLMCLLTALGKTDKDIKPKALAIIFTVCKGQTFQQQPGNVAKSYSTLGSCLSDPTAVATMNSELKAKGFPTVEVVNKDVLTTTAKGV